MSRVLCAVPSLISIGFAEEFLNTDYETVNEEDRLLEDDLGVTSYFDGDFTGAIEHFTTLVAELPESAEHWFRMGCAYRSRYDSVERESGDFQQAVRAWSRALDLDPNNYIYRRRLQQYGPALEKPYPFYNWIDTARSELRERGKEPAALLTEPRGAELAEPARQLAGDAEEKGPDKEGKIQRDDGLVICEVVTIPAPVRPGQMARVVLNFLPAKGVHWTNDAGTLTWTLNRGLGVEAQCDSD